MAEIEVSYTAGEVYYQVDPCPFCGEDRGELADKKILATSYWIECGNCDARGPRQMTIDEAVDGWNKRII